MSQRRMLRHGATQPHRRTSSTGAVAERRPLLAAASASRRRVRRWSAGRGRRGAGRGTRRPRRRREGPDRAADLEDAGPPLAHGEGGAPGGQVGLAGECRVERLEPLRGLQEQRGEPRRRRPETNAAWPRRRSTRARSELVERPGLRRVAGARAPRRAHRPGDSSAQPPARAAHAARDRRSARPRAAGTPPPRRPRREPAPGSAERSSSAATSSSGPGVARARCQARRSGSVSASVASARARCTRWRSLGRGRAVGGGADERVRELDARADGDQAGVHRRADRRPCRSRASRRRGGAAPGRRGAPRPRRGRAVVSRRGAR